MAQLRDQLGRFGIWRPAAQVTPQLAAEVEQAGFGALWLGGSPAGDLEQVTGLLGATSTLVVGTSIVNIWQDSAADVARAAARALGRTRVQSPYLGLVNHTSNLRRLGWPEADLRDGGSDALIDALVAHGSAAEVAAALGWQLDAGADHVAVQVLTEPGADPVPGYRELAQALKL